MGSATLVSVEEYLTTNYDPDCDYVDGEVLERNLGELGHGKLQKALVLYFGVREKQLGVFVIQEQRVQISPTRFRVPDVCIVAGSDPGEQVFTSPPLVCVEILSPSDRVSRLQSKIADYLAFGVRYVWVLDPETRQAFVYTPQGMYEVKDGVLRTENPAIAVPLSEIFG